MLYTEIKNTAKSHYFYQRKGDSQKGGYTVAWRELGDNLVYSVAVCSDKDMFNKRTGRELCDARLNAVSLSEEGSVQIPLNIEKFILVANLDYIKFKLIRSVDLGMFTSSKTIEVAESITLRDISYSYAVQIFNDINFGD
jgi:hypothetical protein